MADVARISPKDLKARLDGPNPPLLVLGYEDEESWRKYRLEHAIPFAAFRDQADALPRDREIVFYCA
jgi:hypothetical protein